MTDSFATGDLLRHGAGAGLRVHRMGLRVYYEDTDFSGVVYHANYLRFLERGRTEFIRSLGLDQKALYAESGIAFVVRRLAIEFERPAAMDDELTVETALHEMRGPALSLDQAIRRGALKLARAQVQVVCIKGGRPLRLPAGLRQAAASFARPGPPGPARDGASQRGPIDQEFP